MERPDLGAANVDWVTDRLAVGGDLDVFDADLAARQAEDLATAGITHVLDLRLELDDTERWAESPAVSYRWDGIDDAGQRVPGEWFERVVGWAMTALEDPEARVLAHCHMGVNRGPSVGFAILLAHGWDPVDAIATIREARPEAYAAYAEDALRWHHRRTGAGREQRRSDEKRLQAWRRDHPLDLVRVVGQEPDSGA